MNIDSLGGKYGLTGPPGTQRLGFGLFLVVNATLPFIAAPAFPQTYGVNLYAESNTTNAFLDGPLPAYVRSIQSDLRGGESRQITATVNATVANTKDITSVERIYLGFGFNRIPKLPLFPGSFGIFASLSGFDWSRIYISLTGLKGWEEVADSAYNQTAAINQGLVYSTSDKVTASRTTLHPSPIFIVVLLLHPILVALMIFWKACFYSTPISEGFGLITLLAGLSRRSSEVLASAAFSRKFRRSVRVQIAVADNNKSRSIASISLSRIQYLPNSDSHHGRFSK